MTAQIEVQTLKLGKVAYRTPGRRTNAVQVTLEIRETEKGKEVSIVGAIWNASGTDWLSGGQNAETIRDLFKGSRKVRRIVELWNRWHLNTMKAGTPAQEIAVKAWQADHQYSYTAACEHLQSIGLYVDNGYTYGSAWLTEQVPVDVLDELRTLFAA